MNKYLLTIIILSSFILPNIAKADITSNLVGWWTFDTANFGLGAGGILDSSGNGNNGTVTQYTIGGTDPTNVTGKIAQAIQFNQDPTTTTVGTYVNIPNYTNFNIGTGDFTVSQWIKTDGIGPDSYQVSFGKDTGSVNGIVVAHYNHGSNGGVAWAYAAGVPTIGNTDVTDNNWHNIIFERSSGVITLYVDNVSQASASSAGNTDIASGVFKLGALATGPDMFHGILDNVRFYSRALSSQDRTDLFNYTGNVTVTFHRFIVNLGRSFKIMLGKSFSVK